jgi:hypothetical protein
VPKGTKATLEYVRNDKPDSLTANFVFSDEAGTWPEIFLGLTGPDWPDKNLHIVAYKITLTGPDGTLLASRQSFLWALPETKVADDATTTASPAATDGNK